MSFPPTVGRYRIDRVLGSGAFASVWLGQDDALDSQVAIKVLAGSLIDDLDVRNRFLEEARILRRADSARLVRVHDIGELPDGRPYFVMSYADRGTLADRMRERPLPVSDALVLAEEIAYGVEVINTLGVIHRDLKPSNVLFQSTPDGGEKLLIADLGLAKALAHASGAFTLPVGTPGYMSPEQARFGGGLDVRADVYGLGALTYHMLTGRPPGPAPVKTAPSELREGLTPAFDHVILRALEVEREKRWPTAEAFAEALATLRPTLAPGSVAPTYGQAVPQQEPDATVSDEYRGPRPSPAQPGAQSPFPGYDQGPSYSHDLAPGQGTQPPQAPVPPPVVPPRPPRRAEPEAPTREDAPAEDDVHTSEMRRPQSRPPGGDEATIVDQPNPHYRPQQSAPAGDPDQDRTVSVPAPNFHPGGPSGPGGRPYDGQAGDDGTTAVFPGQGAPQQSPPPQGYQHGPPPTGFQPPPPRGQGQGKGQGLLGKLKGLGASKSGSGSGQGAPGGPPRPGGGPPQPGGGSPKKNMLPLIIATALLTVAVIGGLLLGNLFSGGDDEKGPAKPSLPADFARISDASGKIQAAAPKAWPKAQGENTWSPAAQGLPGDAQQRPVLRAAPDVAQFKSNGKGPGVFIGLTTDLKNGPLPPANIAGHPRCTKGTPENYTSPDGNLSGTITRFTACKAGTPTVTEVGLKDRTGKYGVWIRVKETDDRNVVKDILNNLKLGAP
ncbi:protein kinase [Spirillospora sp. NPDC050679]